MRISPGNDTTCSSNVTAGSLSFNDRVRLSCNLTYNGSITPQLTWNNCSSAVQPAQTTKDDVTTITTTIIIIANTTTLDCSLTTSFHSPDDPGEYVDPSAPLYTVTWRYSQPVLRKLMFLIASNFGHSSKLYLQHHFFDNVTKMCSNRLQDDLFASDVSFV